MSQRSQLFTGDPFEDFFINLWKLPEVRKNLKPSNSIRRQLWSVVANGQNNNRGDGHLSSSTPSKAKRTVRGSASMLQKLPAKGDIGPCHVTRRLSVIENSQPSNQEQPGSSDWRAWGRKSAVVEGLAQKSSMATSSLNCKEKEVNPPRRCEPVQAQASVASSEERMQN